VTAAGDELHLTLELNAANSDTVTQTTETSVIAFGLFVTMPLDAGSGSGATKMHGRTGIMKLHILEAAQVQVDLDVHRDGSLDSDTPPTWDWLF